MAKFPGQPPWLAGNIQIPKQWRDWLSAMVEWVRVRGTGTVTSITAGTGLTGGTITASGTIGLASSGVTPGSYTLASITVGADGRVTAAANGSGGAGTVTSVAISVPTGLSVSGSPITTSGTFALTWTSGSAFEAIAAETWTGAGSITTVGTIGTGVWHGTAIADSYIASASTWNAKVSSVSASAPLSSTGGTTPIISIGQASSTTSGYLSSTDWNTFNGKGSGTVTGVTASGPLASSGGTAPNLSIPKATASVDGYLSATDWATFNGKGNGTVTSVGVSLPAEFAVSGSPITGTGTLTATWQSQSAYRVLMAPSGGGTPSFQAIPAAALPDLSGTYQLVSAKGAANGYASLDSGGKVPTSQLPASVVGALEYQGTWDASTNTPTIPASSSANKGWYYKVSVAGTTTVDGISDWGVGDWIVSDGAAWDKVDNTESVSSVNGMTGAVTVSTISGNAGTATKLQTPRSIGLTGAVTGSVSFDGSGNVTITAAYAGTLGPTLGGTGLTSYTLGDVVYASAANTLAALAGNTTTTRKFLRQTGTGSGSAAPVWDTLVAGDIPDISATYLKLSGGTMSGNIAMAGNAVVGAKTAMQAVSGAKSVDNTFVDAYVTTDSTGVTWTLQNTGYQGQTILVMQGGNGQITFTNGAGATVWFSASASHTKTLRQGSIVSLLCWGTLLGGNVLWVVAGATA